MVVLVLDGPNKKRGLDFANEQGFEVVAEPPRVSYLEFENGILKVKDPSKGKGYSIYFDFDYELEQLRRQKISKHKDLLARAVGLSKKGNLTILDGTFGVGKDAIHLYSLGAKIIGFEQDQVMWCLAQDALARSQEIDPQRFVLFHKKVETALPEDFQATDCLYLDPMFEAVDKKSLPKKNMAFLRERPQPLFPMESIMSLARKGDVKRVVVKRPLKGKQLYLEPKMAISGKLVRFDVYF